MSYFLYSLVLATGLLVSLPYWLYQVLRHGKYRTGFTERMGRVPARLTWALPRNTIWVHAVSVGEVLAVSGLITEMRRSLPGYRVVVSTTTDTGQQLARKRFGDENVFYFPLDFSFAIRPYLEVLKPELIILAETEFWPNFLHEAHAAGARIAVVNARISDRSRPNYLRFRWALRRMLAHIDLFLAQTDEDATRLRDIGAPADAVQVSGNLKFDLTLPTPPPIVERIRQSLKTDSAGPVLVCGSTVEGEESLLFKAFENVLVAHPRAVMLLAPRHPERFDEVAILLQELGIAFHRRSQWQGQPLAGGVLLVDSIGELAALYAVADVAFVGGSLVPHGGHNIIEPAQHGVAVMTGNHFANFRDIVYLFQSRDAVRVVGMAELPLQFMHLLADEADRLGVGRRAKETMESQMGATERTLSALRSLLKGEPDLLPVSAQAAHND